MVFNNITNLLRQWCCAKSQEYCRAYQQAGTANGGNSRFFSYLVTDELCYKLGTLIDLDFPHYDAYLTAIIQLMCIHVNPSLSGTLGKVQEYYVHMAETAFHAYLKTLTPDCAAPLCPYWRTIWGKEAEGIIAEIQDKWNYNKSYWYPLDGTQDEDRFFISPQWLKPHLAEIKNALGLPNGHIYEYGESMYTCSHCAEVDDLYFYDGLEHVHCPKDFSWIIYYSHENTVTFAGSIVPQIKEILHAEKAHWNHFEWDT